MYQVGTDELTIQQSLWEVYGQHNPPTERFLYRLIKRFGRTGSSADKSTSLRRRVAQYCYNKSECVRNDPNPYIPCRSQELGLSQTTTWRFLHDDLYLKAYNAEIV